MAVKTYATHRLGLAVAWEHKNDLGDIRHDTINFVGGLLTTDDEVKQKYIESLPTFKDETIFIVTLADQIAEAKIKASALRSVADKAVALAQSAEADLAALVKQVAKPVAAAA